MLAWSPMAEAAHPARRPPVVLAVWASLDSTHPVSAGALQVYAGTPRYERGKFTFGGAEVLRPRRSERTASTGVALLLMPALPRQFMVDVRGPRAGKGSVGWTLRALVRNYVPGTVVYVNPVTTLVADTVLATGVEGTPARARRAVDRVLKIPQWFDDADLSYSDHYFNAARYLVAARRAGGIAALERQLVARARRGGPSESFAPSHSPASPRLVGVPDKRVAGAASSIAGLFAASAADGKSDLVKTAFKALAIQAGKSLAGVAAQKAGIAALGWLLAAFGYADVLKDPEVLAIRDTVDALGRQLTELQGQVALGGFTTLIHQTDITIGSIDHARSQLALLAKLPTKDPTKAAFTQTIVSYIALKLVDAPEILNQSLGAKLPVADNLIKAASRAVAERSRFFDSRTSALVTSVYDYFATYQVQLAMLLQELYHAKPDVYSPTVAESNLKAIEANVAAQAGSLKPPVPNDTVIEVKPREMWTQSRPGGPQTTLNTLAKLDFTKRHPFELISPATYKFFLPTESFSDWQLPTMAQFKRLIDGWSG
ncbi:MAG: hypothetical protein JOY58_00325, partial [Solirubrobacterales bacterium]|nr:hypothetical protein [Solirubrobacterales bacterium]